MSSSTDKASAPSNAESAINRISLVARACDRRSDDVKLVHDFILSHLQSQPKPSGAKREERMASRLAAIYALAAADRTVLSALERLDQEAARLSGSPGPMAFILGYVAAGTFIVVFGATYAAWCEADPSGC